MRLKRHLHDLVQSVEMAWAVSVNVLLTMTFVTECPAGCRPSIRLTCHARRQDKRFILSMELDNCR